jgi:membrane protein YqaA with SNARE-associated domain
VKSYKWDKGDTLMKTLYERFLDHVRSRWAIVIAFAWGLAEATAFFIVPDVYMGFVALFSLRRGLAAMLASLLGAIIGGAVMYTLAANNPSGINEFLTRVPMIDAALVSDVAEQTQTRGLLAVLFGPVKGMPYKIYAAQAGEQALPFIYFLLITIVARGERFLPMVLALGGLGNLFKTFFEKHTTMIVGGYILMWCIIYFAFVSYFGFH